MEQYLWVLTDKELDLIREIEAERLAELDEDDLLALHKRVRRARKKYQKNYRRRAKDRVQKAGARGLAATGSDKDRARAYVFEEALSIVSTALSERAHQTAEALKDERLERARSANSASAGPAGTRKQPANTGRARVHQKTTGGKKRDASSRSQGARRQAKRDAR